jgi:predicted GTPase
MLGTRPEVPEYQGEENIGKNTASEHRPYSRDKTNIVSFVEDLKGKAAELLKDVSLRQELEDTAKKTAEDIDLSLQVPVKVLSMGPAGVGKSTLAESIFSFRNKTKLTTELLIKSNIRTGNSDFQRLVIENPSLGAKILLTDSPGFGTDRSIDDKLIPRIIEEIKVHDLVYWVFDASSFRSNIVYPKEVFKKISKALAKDKITLKDKLVIVLNKIDNLPLSPDQMQKGLRAWDTHYNTITADAINHIENLIEYVEELLKPFFGIRREHIVYCNAVTGYRTDLVFNKFMEFLPASKKAKLLENSEFSYIEKSNAARDAYYDSSKQILAEMSSTSPAPSYWRDEIKPTAKTNSVMQQRANMPSAYWRDQIKPSDGPSYDTQQNGYSLRQVDDSNYRNKISSNDIQNHATTSYKVIDGKTDRVHEEGFSEQIINPITRQIAVAEYEDFLRRSETRKQEKSKSWKEWIKETWLKHIQPNIGPFLKNALLPMISQGIMMSMGIPIVPGVRLGLPNPRNQNHSSPSDTSQQGPR